MTPTTHLFKTYMNNYNTRAALLIVSRFRITHSQPRFPVFGPMEKERPPAGRNDVYSQL
jgi:hypothetical protein